jgi:hypothetical protein
MSWEMGPGVVEFPDGVRVRGRGLKREAWPDPRPERRFVRRFLTADRSNPELPADGGLT